MRGPGEKVRRRDDQVIEMTRRKGERTRRKGEKEG